MTVVVPVKVFAPLTVSVPPPVTVRPPLVFAVVRAEVVKEAMAPPPPVKMIVGVSPDA